MAWSRIGAGNGGGHASSSIAASAVNVSVGDLIAVHVKWSTATRTITITDTAGNDAGFVSTTVQNSNGTLYGQWFYCLSAANANASDVVTASFGSATDYYSIVVEVWSHSGTATHVANDFGATTFGGTVQPTTGITLTSGDLALMSLTEYQNNPGINWQAIADYTGGATDSSNGAECKVFYKQPSGTSEQPTGQFGPGPTSATLLGYIIGFNEAAGGGGGSLELMGQCCT